MTRDLKRTTRVGKLEVDMKPETPKTLFLTTGSPDPTPPLRPLVGFKPHTQT